MVNMFVNLIRHSDRTGWTIERVPGLWREPVRQRCIELGIIEADEESEPISDEGGEDNAEDQAAEQIG
ncbi:hypothetical protein [Facklamia sp. P9177]|uniref:hypothetical protein n=1 Tax=Facklamia sp. P9177 TaxID=3421945 RepID=UPI003D16863C